jgi:hypothetical protein
LETEIDCPRCSRELEEKTHGDGIKLELCPCYDRPFLDAGKISDLKYETFSEKIKGILKYKRK